MVKLGATRGSSIPWQGKFGFNWADDFEILGIQYNMKKLHEITDLNIQRKMGEIQKLIRIWSTRNFFFIIFTISNCTHVQQGFYFPWHVYITVLQIMSFWSSISRSLLDIMNNIKIEKM